MLADCLTKLATAPVIAFLQTAMMTQTLKAKAAAALQLSQSSSKTVPWNEKDVEESHEEHPGQDGGSL